MKAGRNDTRDRRFSKKPAPEEREKNRRRKSHKGARGEGKKGVHVVLRGGAETNWWGSKFLKKKNEGEEGAAKPSCGKKKRESRYPTMPKLVKR